MVPRCYRRFFFLFVLAISENVSMTKILTARLPFSKSEPLLEVRNQQLNGAVLVREKSWVQSYRGGFLIFVRKAGKKSKKTAKQGKKCNILESPKF